MIEDDIELLLSGCESEPIRNPGAIQPHGIMLVVDPATGRLIATAGDVEKFIGQPIGPDLPDYLLGPCLEEFLTGIPDTGPGLVRTVQQNGRDLQILAHRANGCIVLELEPSVSSLSAGAVLGQAQLLSSQLESAQAFEEVSGAAATHIYEITGYDRVLVYQFLDDGTGVVIAEAGNEKLPLLLHHHFPESDIPRQARELYTRNLIRVIPNTGYQPVSLIWLSGEEPAEPFDMSDCHLRSVSPIHLQYMRNMGVDASASISLMVDGKLWGLVTCHNLAVRNLDFVQRELCKLVGQIVSAKIGARQRSVAQMERVALGQRAADLLPVLSGLGPVEHSVLRHAADVMAIIPCDGVVVQLGRELATEGSVPPEAELEPLVSWISQFAAEEPFATHRLGFIYAQAQSFASSAAGALSVTIRTDPPVSITWFRAEQLQTINWAGNPHKDNDNLEGHLTPRTSFELWRQLVDGEASRWSRAEIEAAGNFGTAIRQVIDGQNLAALNRELRQAVTAGEDLLAQKDILMREVHHRVQNSLQLVNAVLAIQSRSTDNEEVRTQFDLAQQRLTAVAMVHKRLWRSDKLGDVRFDSFVTELLEELTSIWGADWKRFVNIHVPPITLPTDKAIPIGLILTELLTNAVKYAYGGEAGPLFIEATEYRDKLTMVIADRGKGRDATTKRSFGSRLVDALTRQVSGSIELSDNKPGLRAVLEVPTD